MADDPAARIRDAAATLPARPARAPGTPPKPKGDSGRFHTDGFLDHDETNPDLISGRGLEKFDEMWRTDGDSRRALTMAVSPIASGTYTVDPWRESAESEDEPGEQDRMVAEFVHDVLNEHMRPKLKGHLWQAATVAGRCGFAPFEQVYRRGEWRGRPIITLATLDLRLPKTIQRWRQDGHELVALEQLTLRHGTAVIPRRDLVYYRFGAEGDNWEGQSLLRPAFKHWRYKDVIERVQAIGIERTAVGVPVGYPPVSADDDALDEFEAFLAEYRASEGAYFMAPGPRADHASTPNGTDGWFVEILAPSVADGAARAITEALQYHEAKIDAVIIAEFMRLGQQGEGARATADVQQDPFYALIDALAQIVIVDEINERLIPRLVDLNFDVAGCYPRLRCSLIDSTSLTDLAAFVATLSAQKAIRVEPTLEAFLRKRAGLPPADEDAIEENVQKAAEQAREMAALKSAQQPAGDGKPGKESVVEPPGAKADPRAKPDAKSDPSAQSDDPAAKSRRLARADHDLRSWEAFVSLDRIESALDGARDRVEQVAAVPARALAVDLAGLASRGRALPAADAPVDLVDAIASELAALYDQGRDTVREELRRQADIRLGWEPGAMMLDDAQNPEPPTEWFSRMAREMANAVRAAIVAALGRLRAMLRGGQDVAGMQAAGEAAGRAALRTEAQHYAAPALGQGRVDQARVQTQDIAGSRYTSILDGRRCPTCATADDDVLRPLDDPVRLARVPPNPACQGGGKCRCLEAFELRDEAPSYT